MEVKYYIFNIIISGIFYLVLKYFNILNGMKIFARILFFIGIFYFFICEITVPLHLIKIQKEIEELSQKHRKSHNKFYIGRFASPNIFNIYKFT